MKKDIHPEYFPEAVVRCACGNTWTTGSTVAEVRTDVCSACHPFFTGEQRIVDSEGRVDRFYRRLEHARQMQGAPEAEAPEAETADADTREEGGEE
jgi:large subunit ribosomal protein L31